MLDKIIFYCFSLLFFLVPLFWTPLNFELFEFNKMFLVYFLTIVIVGIWLLKIVNRKSLIVNQTPLDIPLLLFLGANILSTIFSIDPHSSIWGYYSRSNGGLLSIISYSVLYWAFVSNIQKDQVFHLLKVALISGFIISVWGIFEHFGVSPSCVILRAEFNASCWVQDVQARVFATLGQPNWMAAYLGMLIFPAMYFFLTASSRKQLITYHLSLITLYLAFTFTYSRGATLGFLAGLAIMVTFFARKRQGSAKQVLILIITFILINLIFGSAFTRFNITQVLPKYTSELNPNTSEVKKSSSITQLESGGTESGQIRLIVWKGALDIFKAYPIFGSGLETFAYSYYQFRPVSHNLVSEWDFLYNKAHNEYLNYLATTGIVGLFSYSIIILTFIIVILRKLNLKNLLLLSLLASYLSYLVSNFFGFSVVITALFFFLFPALAFVISDTISPLQLPKKLYPLSYTLAAILYRRKLYTKALKVLMVFSTLYLLFSIFKLWYGDFLFAKGLNYSEGGNVGLAYNYIKDAVIIRPNEPFYRSELSFAAAASAVALSQEEASLSAKLKDEAISEIALALRKSPKNISFWKTAIRTYFELSSLDKTFIQKTLDATEKAINLAPTDAKLLYNKAIILGQDNKPYEAIAILQEALRLKPNYREGYIALALFYFDEGQKLEAVESMKKVLQIIPNDPEALQNLNDWGRQGIATGSAQ